MYIIIIIAYPQLVTCRPGSTFAHHSPNLRHNARNNSTTVPGFRLGAHYSLGFGLGAHYSLGFGLGAHYSLGFGLGAHYSLGFGLGAHYSLGFGLGAHCSPWLWIRCSL